MLPREEWKHHPLHMKYSTAESKSKTNSKMQSCWYLKALIFSAETSQYSVVGTSVITNYLFKVLTGINSKLWSCSRKGKKYNQHNT